MRLLADERSEIDRNVLAVISESARAETLSESNLDDCFALFAMACNHVDGMRLELTGFTQSYRFDFDERSYTVMLDDGRCASYAGEVEMPDVNLKMSTATALGLVNGAVDPGVAHMNGDILCRGTKNGSIKLQWLFELFLDELGV